jgi:prepilin-type N-terminal cleavage/methylation domain-containing protein
MKNIKFAFTLLELVFVLVVIGILAAAIIPETKSTALQECANQVLSHIRYTQHLAIINDNITQNDSEWYKHRWQLLFGKSNFTDGKYAYSIFCDYDGDGNPDIREIAKNPLDQDKLLTGGFSGIIKSTNEKVTKQLYIGYKFNINQITSSGCGNSKRIAFDYDGKPIYGNSKNWKDPQDNILNKNCELTLSNDEGSFTITIVPQTGYSYISSININ